MMTALLIFGALWAVALAFVAVQLRRAPVAFEDENGFHVVEQQSVERTVLVPALRTG